MVKLAFRPRQSVPGPCSQLPGCTVTRQTSGPRHPAADGDCPQQGTQPRLLHPPCCSGTGWEALGKSVCSLSHLTIVYGQASLPPWARVHTVPDVFHSSVSLPLLLCHKVCPWVGGGITRGPVLVMLAELLGVNYHVYNSYIPVRTTRGTDQV